MGCLPSETVTVTITGALSNTTIQRTGEEFDRT